jgi:ubiquinone/menaquinone biosynthesis C-methylase UbiE
MGFFSNMRKPEGKLGNIQLKSMNKEHTPVSLWGLKHLNISPDDVILDIGCGGGMNINRMAQGAKKVYGVDYSIESVNLSKEVNEDLIKEGRVEVHEGNVMDLPFEDNSFDIVTAFETVYFWPDIVKSFGEVKRVLKPGCMFLIGCEANGTNNLAMKFFDKVVDMTFYEDNDLVGFLKSNDFKDVTVYLRDGKNKQEIIKKEDGKTVKIDDDYDNFSISDRFVEWMTVTAIK